MGTSRGFDQTSGYLLIGTITSVNPETFRCDLEFPGSYATAMDVPLTPSPLIGFMPEPGTQVAVYSRPGLGNRIISILDTPDGRQPGEVLEKENKPGTIPRMETGDVYIGHRGRAYFNKHGDVRISSRGSRATLELKSEKAKAELYAYNFDLFTPGSNVRIRSKSTVDTGPAQTWGDSLSMEVNVPLAPGLDTAPEVLQTNLGRVRIDRFGSTNIDVLPTTAWAVNLEMSITGLISLGRGYPTKTVGLEMGQVGIDSIDLFTPKHALSLDSVQGEVSLTNTPGLVDLSMSDLGHVHLGSDSSYFAVNTATHEVVVRSALGDITLFDSGAFSLTNDALDYSIAGTSASLLMAGKTAGLSATTGPLSLSSATMAALSAPLIQLGLVSGGHVAFAEALVLVFQQLNLLHQALKTHIHPVVGVVTSGAGAGGAVAGSTSPSLQLAVSGLIPAVPTASQIGSTTVTAQV